MKVFHVNYETGDTDFGATYGEAKITIEDKGVWDDEAIRDVKYFLAGFYGCDMSSVRTEEERLLDDIDFNNHIEEEIKKLGNSQQ